MARRTFDVIDICEIFVHWHAGRSKNEVAESLGLSRNTVRKYGAAAEAAGMCAPRKDGRYEVKAFVLTTAGRQERKSAFARSYQEARQKLTELFSQSDQGIPVAERVLIVGGGIGGLTLAAALRQHGFDAEVVELNNGWHTEGAGLSVQPNGLRVLGQLGLDSAVVAAGSVVGRWLFADQHGGVLQQQSRAVADSFNMPPQARDDVLRTRGAAMFMDRYAPLAAEP